MPAMAVVAVVGVVAVDVFAVAGAVPVAVGCHCCFLPSYPIFIDNSQNLRYVLACGGLELFNVDVAYRADC